MSQRSRDSKAHKHTIRARDPKNVIDGIVHMKLHVKAREKNEFKAKNFGPRFLFFNCVKTSVGVHCFLWYFETKKWFKVIHRERNLLAGKFGKKVIVGFPSRICEKSSQKFFSEQAITEKQVKDLFRAGNYGKAGFSKIIRNPSEISRNRCTGKLRLAILSFFQYTFSFTHLLKTSN